MHLSIAASGAMVVLLTPTVFAEEGGVNFGGNRSNGGNWSYVGVAAYDLLSTQFARHRPRLWDLTSGKVVGDLHYTPRNFWDPPGDTNDPPEGHSDWFPEKLGEIVARTTEFCDVMSLSPPDGMFQEELNGALRLLADRAESLPRTSPIRVRMMFGHIVAEPVNVTGVVEKLTEGISPEANLQLWVGAWRDKLSWNHAKLIAVDGRYLHTGGHNMWDSDYLREDPVHDLSFELEGQVTYGAHYFSNWQWNYLQQNEGQEYGSILDLLPEIWRQDEALQSLILYISTQVTIPPLNIASVAEFPSGVAAKFPPQYNGSSALESQLTEEVVPIISMGKQGTVLEDEPSEDAFVAMFDAARSSIKCAQQDLGPRMVSPDYPIPFPGFSWPENHLSALGRALVRGVDVEIILSNLGAREHGGYSNGWPCDAVAAQIIGTIPRQFPEEVNVTDKARLREIVGDKLRIGFLRGKFGNQWGSGKDIAFHTKHFIIDDICAYIGSENLYSFDLAEWGLVVDDENQTRKIMEELWEPLYEYSYTGQDCDLDEVVNNLDVESDLFQDEIMVDLVAEYFNITDIPDILLDLLSGGPVPPAFPDWFAPEGNGTSSDGEVGTVGPTSSPLEASGAPTESPTSSPVDASMNLTSSPTVPSASGAPTKSLTSSPVDASVKPTSSPTTQPAAGQMGRSVPSAAGQMDRTAAFSSLGKAICTSLLVEVLLLSLL